MSAQDNERILELDGIRGLAALAILVFHLPWGFWFGATAVDLFFVLSGYLITGIIIKNHRKPGFFRVFYARRGLRIWPIYYLAFLAVLLLNTLRANPLPADGWPWYALYLQHVPAYWGAETGEVPSFGHTWTLAIEEQFYTVWPPIVAAIGGRALPLRLFCVVMLVVAFAVRSAGLDVNTLLAHMDGLALGGLLATAPIERFRQNSKTLATWSFALGGFVSLCLYAAAWSTWAGSYGPASDHRQPAAALTFVSFAYFFLVALILVQRDSVWTRPLRNPWVVYVGTISYGVYLFHWIVYELLDTVFKFGMGFADPLWLDALKIGASFLVAALSWRFIESPALRLKKFFNYRTT